MESAAECDGHVSVLLGAYVLGGLSAREASAVRTHLTCCVRCQAEHDELASLTSVLDLLASPETDQDHSPR